MAQSIGQIAKFKRRYGEKEEEEVEKAEKWRFKLEKEWITSLGLSDDFVDEFILTFSLFISS